MLLLLMLLLLMLLMLLLLMLLVGWPQLTLLLLALEFLHTYKYSLQCHAAVSIVADPDPYVFGPPGSRSISMRYGSGSLVSTRGGGRGLLVKRFYPLICSDSLASSHLIFGVGVAYSSMKILI
jgi:hypothetical protein